MAVHEPLFGTLGYVTDFPGLTKESAEWLGRKGIVSFGVEAVSPGRPGRAGRQGALPFHRLSVENQGGQRQPHPRSGGPERVGEEKEVVMSIDRFGNQFAPALPYARGKILAETFAKTPERIPALLFGDV